MTDAFGGNLQIFYPLDEKPRLVLLHGRIITAENIAKMFKALTGRGPEVSPEWLERTNAGRSLR